MNDKDYAIIVGIDQYPGISDLKGTIHDAYEFKRWLTHQEGGKVPEANIRFIAESRLEMEKPDIIDAQPAFHELQKEFRRLLRFGKKIRDSGDDLDVDTLPNPPYQDEVGYHYIGRRLYMYFSGHGFSSVQSARAASLIAADGDEGRNIMNSIPGVSYSDWMETKAYFKEVVLVMDCCRIPAKDIMPMYPYEDPSINDTRHVRRWHALSCLSNQKSRERDFDGITKGVFTNLFLDALWNAPPHEPGSNKVTPESIRLYFKSAAADGNGDYQMDQEPDLEDGRYENEIVLVERELKPIECTITFPDDYEGCEAKILDGLDLNKSVSTFTIQKGKNKVDLHLQGYLVMVFEKSKSQLISVTRNTRNYVIQ